MATKKKKPARRQLSHREKTDIVTSSVQLPVPLYKKASKYAKEYEGRNYQAQVRVLIENWIAEIEEDE